MPLRWLVACVSCLLVIAVRASGAEEAKPATPSYAQVQAIFQKNCLSCHDAKEAEGELVMETYGQLMKGGEKGVVIVPGDAGGSRLVQSIERTKKPFMPPPKKAPKLGDKEIALIRAWIDGGAHGPAAGEAVAVAPSQPAAVSVPKIEPKVTPRLPVLALTYEAKGKLIAAGKADAIELISAESQGVVRKLVGHHGNVNAVAFTADGSRLVSAAGQPGVGGELKVWNVADGTVVRSLAGHKDAIYSLALSPDGKLAATGAYDHKILLWDLEAGKVVRTLEGHNGAVLGLSFRNDGKVLASVSADRTLKLWEVPGGKRLDTRPESNKDLNTVSFTPDGRFVAAGGVDNRIRVWQVSAGAAEGTNPIVFAQFAHEGAILKLAYSANGKMLATSADDKTVKLWDAGTLAQKVSLAEQPDWPTALAFAEGDKVLVVGRIDGSIGFYDVGTGKVVPPPKPEVASAEPRGVRRGKTVRVTLTGKNLGGLKEVKVSGDKVTGKVLNATNTTAVVELTAGADAMPGAVDLTVAGPGGSSAAEKILIDTLPQVEAGEGAGPVVAALPATFGGKFDRMGRADLFAFDAKGGEQIVFDCASRRLGSKAEVVLTVTDPSGKVVASGGGDYENPETLLAFTPAADGRYTVRVAELTGAASGNHFYRVAAGAMPVVTDVFPLAVPAGAETAVRLVGPNVPAGAVVKVKAPAEGEVEVPGDLDRFRVRRALKVLVSTVPETIEAEPNDSPGNATAIAVPGAAEGRIGSAADVDLYRFAAKAGERVVLETVAAQRGSPIDTRIEVLYPDGRPVQRLQLRAVRDSALTFKSIDANANGGRLVNYEEMELNQYLYMNGEVVRLYIAPRGPDSEYNFYSVGGSTLPGDANGIIGKRRSYFDTSPIAHALDEPCYVVEPHAAGEKLPANGLPVFPLYYANDDDALRQLGADSRLIFTAPADGEYLVRVSDTRSFGGERFIYRLVARPAAPDFKVSLLGLANATIPRGAGLGFTARVERIDGFDGPVKVEIAGLPAGLVATTPLVIEAGHTDARGTLYAAPDAPEGELIEATELSPKPARGMAGKAPKQKLGKNTNNPVAPGSDKTPAAGAGAEAVAIKVTAAATIGGKGVSKPVNDFGKVTVRGKPLVYVALGPAASPTTAPSAEPQPSVASAGPVAPSTRPSIVMPEVTITPGALTPAYLRIVRNGFEEEIRFDVEDMPHGVIVADIGLNGVLILKGQNERQIFFHCAKWVQPQTRIVHVRARDAGLPTSYPVLLRVGETK